MRIGKVFSGLAGIAAMLGVSQMLAAQSSASVANGNRTVSSGSVVGSIGGIEGTVGITGAPYSATRKSTRVQKLADGTTITHETTVKEARDSSGRTYHESRPEFVMGAEDSASFVAVNVHDPVKRIRIFWDSNTKEAVVTHFPEPGGFDRTNPMQGQATMEQARRPRVEPIKPQIEDLGMKTINGVEARGTRSTRVIPTGREGNDRPITVTSERWISEELKLAVMSVSEDPRSGTSTMELIDIDMAEPDPVLFQVPEGYSVRDRNPRPQN